MRRRRLQFTACLTCHDPSAQQCQRGHAAAARGKPNPAIAVPSLLPDVDDRCAGDGARLHAWSRVKRVIPWRTPLPPISGRNGV